VKRRRCTSEIGTAGGYLYHAYFTPSDLLSVARHGADGDALWLVAAVYASGGASVNRFVLRLWLHECDAARVATIVSIETRRAEKGEADLHRLLCPAVRSMTAEKRRKEGRKEGIGIGIGIG
jgi:hypothetical protein